MRAVGVPSRGGAVGSGCAASVAGSGFATGAVSAGTIGRSKAMVTGASIARRRHQIRPPIPASRAASIAATNGSHSCQAAAVSLVLGAGAADWPGSVEKIGVALGSGAGLTAPGVADAAGPGVCGAGPGWAFRIGTAWRGSAAERGTAAVGCGVDAAGGCVVLGVGEGAATLGEGRGAGRGDVITGLSGSTGPCTRGGGAAVGLDEGSRKSLTAWAFAKPGNVANPAAISAANHTRLKPRIPVQTFSCDRMALSPRER